MVKVLNVVGARPNFHEDGADHRRDERSEAARSRRLSFTPGNITTTRCRGRSSAIWECPSRASTSAAGGGTHAEQTARVMLAFEGVVVASGPDWVVVVGDVNSTLACALVAGKLRVRVAHVEAGLRSFDWTMPEEINRVLDRPALRPVIHAEPGRRCKISCAKASPPNESSASATCMIDTLYRQIERARDARRSSTTCPSSARDFAAMTLHRPSNVDDPDALRRIFAALGRIARALPSDLPRAPAQPAPDARIRRRTAAGRHGDRSAGLSGFPEAVEQLSKLTLTDSGGLQEETTALGVPCLTLRENTERPITVEQGTNQVVGLDPERIVAAAEAIIADGHSTSARAPELWDGRAAERIVAALLERSHQ